MPIISRICAVVLAVLFLATNTARGQAVVIVRSNDPDAGVLIDSTWVGKATSGPFRVKSGRRLVRVIPGIPGTWGLAPVHRLLELADGDTVTVHGHFSVPNDVEREGRIPHVGITVVEPARSQKAWIDYVAISGAIVAGAVAVHYKMKADSRYDVYGQTGDPTLRPEIKRLDTRAGIAVGAMQVGITVFAIRLLGR